MNYYLVAQTGERYHLVPVDDAGLLVPGRRIRWHGSEHSVNDGTITRRIGLEFEVTDITGVTQIPIERIIEVEMTPEEAQKVFP